VIKREVDRLLGCGVFLTQEFKLNTWEKLLIDYEVLRYDIMPESFSHLATIRSVKYRASGALKLEKALLKAWLDSLA